MDKPYFCVETVEHWVKVTDELGGLRLMFSSNSNGNVLLSNEDALDLAMCILKELPEPIDITEIKPGDVLIVSGGDIEGTRIGTVSHQNPWGEWVDKELSIIVPKSHTGYIGAISRNNPTVPADSGSIISFEIAGNWSYPVKPCWGVRGNDGWTLFDLEGHSWSGYNDMWIAGRTKNLKVVSMADVL